MAGLGDNIRQIHSSLIQEAWFRDLPTLVLHPPGHSDFNLDRLLPGTDSYAWGIRRANCICTSYTDARLARTVEQFLSIAVTQ